MFLGANCLSICLSVFWCLDYSRINEQIFIKKIFVGRTWSKEEVTKRKIWILFWIQKIKNFSFQCIFIEFGFLLDISSKINLHVWFYFIVFLTILYITLETGHMESNVLHSLSASCNFFLIDCPHLRVANRIEA